MVTIELAELTDFNAVLDLYSSCKCKGVIDPRDTIVIARNNKKLIGAARLCVENEMNILRGMQIVPSMQRQKIGSKMLYFCLPLMQKQTTYCISYSHLTNFYNQIGFQLISENEMPITIKNKFLKDRSRGQEVVPMMRAPRSRQVTAS